MEYIPDGLTKEQWELIKKKVSRKKFKVTILQPWLLSGGRRIEGER